MSQIKIIATDLDIQPILHQVLDNPHDWQMVSGLAKNNPNKIGGDQEPPGFLPLTMGVASPGEDIKNSEKQKNTPIYTKYTQVHHFWKRIQNDRCFDVVKTVPQDGVPRSPCLHRS